MREIVLDTETTGFDPLSGDRIVELGAVELMNHMPTGRTFHRHVNPQRAVPAEAEAITLLLPSPPASVLDGSAPVFAIVDDGAPMHNWHECRTDNNTSDPVSGKCDEPQ